MNAIVSTSERALLISPAQPLDQHPALVYLTRLGSDHSRRNMRRYLDQIANGILRQQWEPPRRAMFASTADYQQAHADYQQAIFALRWGALRYQHTQAIRAQFTPRYAPRTVNVMLSALRGVLEQAWNLGQMTAEDYQRAVKVENVTVETLPAGRDVNAGEIIALSQICFADDSPAGVRDAAIIGLLYIGGLRRSEVANLNLADYDPENGQIKVRAAKGKKDRTVYVTNGAQTALTDWLAIRGDEAGAIFTPVNKGGALVLEHTTAPDGSLIVKPMSSQTIYNLLQKRAAAATLKPLTVHDFRRTFVGDMLDRGVDIATVANIAGHASVNTTARYDRRPEKVKELAAQKLHYPYQRRAKRDND